MDDCNIIHRAAIWRATDALPAWSLMPACNNLNKHQCSVTLRNCNFWEDPVQLADSHDDNESCIVLLICVRT